jgi:hypothetical protein
VHNDRDVAVADNISLKHRVTVFTLDGGVLAVLLLRHVGAGVLSRLEG